MPAQQLRISRQIRQARRLTAGAVQTLPERLFADLPARSPKRLSEGVARELLRIDRESDFTPAAGPLFQDLLAMTGLPTMHPIRLPVNDDPLWFLPQLAL